MTRKKKVASAAAPGGRPSARDPSPDSVDERLKSLNCLLEKKTLERRGEIELLRSELDDLAAGYSVLDGIECDVFRLVLSSQITDAAACGSAELRRVEAYLAGEMATLVENNRSLEQELARISAALEVAEENRGKLEEEGRRKEKILLASLHEKASLENCLEEKKQLVEKIVSDMEEMGRHKEAEIEVLNTENKAIAVKVSTFEKEYRYLEALKDRLQNEATHLMASLAELKKDNVELVASSRETEMRHVMVEEELKSFLNKLQLEKLELESTLELKVGEMNLQMDELKENMTKMTVEKEVLDQTNAEYGIKIGKLIQEKMELCSARIILEDAHSSFQEKFVMKNVECDTAQGHLKFLVKEVDALRLQIKELMKSKDMVELKHKKLENKMNEATLENEKRRKHINSLISEKASLEKLHVSAQERLSEMASEMASVRTTLALLSKTTTEVNGQERAQGNNIMSVETGVEMENDEALQPFVEEIKLALKNRESKIEEMEQELELLQLTVADAQKSSLGVWKWLCPTTTTIFAAVSLTYYVVARAR